MDYYFDDFPEQVWFDISEFYTFKGGYLEKGVYLINRNGDLFSKFSNRNMTMSKEIYPSYNLTYIGGMRAEIQLTIKEHKYIYY